MAGDSLENKLKDLTNRKATIKEEAKQLALSLMQQVSDDLDVQVVFTAEPNSYCDEGYHSEGNVVLYGGELDAMRSGHHIDSYYGADEPGIWSQDYEYGDYTKFDDKYTLAAKELFNQLTSLTDLLGMDGWFQLKTNPNK